MGDIPVYVGLVLAAIGFAVSLAIWLAMHPEVR